MVYNNSMVHTLKYTLVIVVVVAIAVTVFGLTKHNPVKTTPSAVLVPPTEPVVCTQEAKQCPDGSYVSRTGPHCEFTACPEVAPPSTLSIGYVSGHITIGPFCPVERPGQPCPVPPSAYSSRQVVAYQADGTTIVEKGIIDSTGNYKIALTSGTYYIQIQPAGIGAGEKKQVAVEDKKTTVVDFNIDTGIR